MRKRTKLQAGEDLRSVAIYARKSRITNKGDSIGVQFKQSADYAINQLSLPEDYEFLHYEDKGLSGYYSDRPDFQRLLHDIDKGKIKAVACYKLDRISRKTSDLMRLLEYFERHNVQLRQECAAIMREQGHEEETGRAKITGAYNLPCKYVLHTVGPVISGTVTRKDEELLASCYRSCLEVAEEHGVRSIAFCCISTGEFHFPNDRAAEIAVQTVKQFKEHSKMKVIFNVFKGIDKEIYEELLR